MGGWVFCWATAISTMGARILSRATTTGTHGAGCFMRSTCSTSRTLGTIATAGRLGWVPLGRTWIFDSRDQGVRDQGAITFREPVTQPESNAEPLIQDNTVFNSRDSNP